MACPSCHLIAKAGEQRPTSLLVKQRRTEIEGATRAQEVIEIKLWSFTCTIDERFHDDFGSGDNGVELACITSKELQQHEMGVMVTRCFQD